MPFIAEQLSADGVTEFGRIVWAKALLDTMTNYTVESIVSIDTPGSGYVVGETFELDNAAGTPIFHARGEVLAVDGGGGVTQARIISCGAYSTAPPTSGGVATTNASASGNNALVVDLSVNDPLWTVDNENYADAATDFEFIATSTYGSGIAPTVGFKTFLRAGSIPRVLLQGQLAYNGLFSFEGQDGKSPGAVTAQSETGACVNCTDADPVLFASITERRVICVCADPPRYQVGYVGLFVPFVDDPGNYPYPIMAAGTCVLTSSETINTNYDDGPQSDVRQGHSSVVHPWTDSDNDGGDTSCYAYRDNLTPSWIQFDGRAQGGSGAYVWPNKGDNSLFTHAPEILGQSTDPFNFNTGAIGEDDWFEADGAGANTPGVSPIGDFGRNVLPVPCQLIKGAASSVELIGFIDGLYAVHGRGLTEEDRIEDLDGVRYLCIPDTGGAPLSKWLAIAEV